MDRLLQQIEGLKQEIGSYQASNAEELEQFRIKYLGAKGLVKSLMGEMKNVSANQKKEFGQVLNEFKQFTESRYEELKHLSMNGNGAGAGAGPIRSARSKPSGRSDSDR